MKVATTTTASTLTELPQFLLPSQRRVASSAATKLQLPHPSTGRAAVACAWKTQWLRRWIPRLWWTPTESEGTTRARAAARPCLALALTQHRSFVRSLQPHARLSLLSTFRFDWMTRNPNFTPQKIPRSLRALNKHGKSQQRRHRHIPRPERRRKPLKTGALPDQTHFLRMRSSHCQFATTIGQSIHGPWNEDHESTTTTTRHAQPLHSITTDPVPASPKLECKVRRKREIKVAAPITLFVPITISSKILENFGEVNRCDYEDVLYVNIEL